MRRTKLTQRQAFLLMCAVELGGIVHVPTHDHGQSSTAWVVDGKKRLVRNVLGYGRVEANGLVKRGLMTVAHNALFTITAAGRAALVSRADLIAELIVISDAKERREQAACDAEDAEWRAARSKEVE